ncbi:MAG: HD domain-containing protein, partial [Planctomycetota bacterium]
LVRVHDGGIRDGLVTQMLDEIGFRPQMRRNRSVEMLRQVRAFARRCRYEQGHSEHFARIALTIFDQLAAQAGDAQSPLWLREHRDLLHAGALLHDVGVVIDYARHHKHSYDLILKSRMTIFSQRELRLIALIARYHRRALPARRHAAYARLSEDDQRVVSHLAGVLRIADGLDRTHTQNVRAVAVRAGPRRVRVAVSADESPEVNLRYARRKSDLLEKVLGVRIEFQWRGAAVMDTRTP